MNDINSLRQTHDAALTSILEMVAALDGDDDDEAHMAILEDPLSIEIRPPWCSPGDTVEGPDAYRILLTTGGPAVRIVGGLDDCGEPETAVLEVQDWFQPWTRFPTSKEEDQALMRYTACFCYSS